MVRITWFLLGILSWRHWETVCISKTFHSIQNTRKWTRPKTKYYKFYPTYL